LGFFGVFGLQQNKLSVVDLFAGCGGFGLGLEQAGFETIFVNELNDDARATYMANRRGHLFARDLDESSWLNKFSCSDVRKMVNGNYLEELQDRFQIEFGIKRGEIDLVVGGPPCQGFSGIGHRRSYAVDKKVLPSNHLFKDMATIVGRLRPRAFVFENVRGLLTGKWTNDGEKGEIWKDVKRAFIEIGEYVLAAELVYAKDYGVAQNRPRILLIGVRSDVVGTPATKPAEIDAIDGTAIDRGFLPKRQPGSAPHLRDLLGDLVDKDYANGLATTSYPHEPKEGIQTAFRTLPDGTVAGKGAPVTEHEYSKHRPEVVEKFKAMLGGKDYTATKKFAQRVLPSEWEPGKGPTITATSLPDDYVHFRQPRTLSVREWARLQGFPDWYKFKGKRTTGGVRRAGNPIEGIHFRELPKYTQIGNAVPVPLARAIGENLKRILQKVQG
jgi:DNA (cytosine-5)-methyltransferase 1